jgi:hypothetical protein
MRTSVLDIVNPQKAAPRREIAARFPKNQSTDQEYPACLGGGKFEPCPVLDQILRGQHPRAPREVVEAAERVWFARVDEAVDALLDGQEIPDTYPDDRSIAIAAVAIARAVINGGAQ